MYHLGVSKLLDTVQCVFSPPEADEVLFTDLCATCCWDQCTCTLGRLLCLREAIFLIRLICLKGTGGSVQSCVKGRWSPESPQWLQLCVTLTSFPSMLLPSCKFLNFFFFLVCIRFLFVFLFSCHLRKYYSSSFSDFCLPCFSRSSPCLFSGTCSCLPRTATMPWFFKRFFFL